MPYVGLGTRDPQRISILCGVCSGRGRDRILCRRAAVDGHLISATDLLSRLFSVLLISVNVCFFLAL